MIVLIVIIHDANSNGNDTDPEAGRNNLLAPPNAPPRGLNEAEAASGPMPLYILVVNPYPGHKDICRKFVQAGKNSLAVRSGQAEPGEATGNFTVIRPGAAFRVTEKSFF